MDLQANPSAREELEALGIRSMPVTVIGDQIIRGFKPKLLSEALKLGLKVTAKDPTETLPLLERALGSVERTIRQMPDDKLDWTLPERDRPMSEFTYHIFKEAEDRSLALERGDHVSSGHEAGRAYKSFQDIADFAAGVVERYKTWASRQDAAALRRLPSGGNDHITPVERLDILTGHTIQHMRQLYWVLENFGITPEHRIPDEELPSEMVLSTLF